MDAGAKHEGTATVQGPEDERRHAVMAAIAKRLSRVRGSMTDAEFGLLLADMVRVAERFAEIEARPGALLSSMPPEEIRRLLDIEPG